MKARKCIVFTETAEHSLEDIEKAVAALSCKGELAGSPARCPLCQRGDIWQEAINRAEYVYNCDEMVKGQEVIDYILAEVAAMLEQANA